MAKQSNYVNDNTSQSINIINEGTVIKGNVVATGDMRVDGELVGNIDAKGRLVIGPHGKVDGEIQCKNIEVAGFVKGKIQVEELLTMKSTAKIFGDVVAGKLSVEPGSLFTGSCIMGDKLVSPAQNGKPVQKE